MSGAAARTFRRMVHLPDTMAQRHAWGTSLENQELEKCLECALLPNDCIHKRCVAAGMRVYRVGATESRGGAIPPVRFCKQLAWKNYACGHKDTQVPSQGALVICKFADVTFYVKFRKSLIGLALVGLVDIATFSLF